MFLEAAFYDTPGSSGVMRWLDKSNADYFMFESPFGAARLRKRNAYPATFMEASGSQLLFGYGELGIGRSIAGRNLRDVHEEQFYDHEFLFVTADAATQSVTVQRDALSTLPVFVGRQPDRLILSNRFDRVAALLDRTHLTLDPVALTEFLCLLRTYDRTFCQEIKLLYDRARLEWSPRKQALTRPAHAHRMHKHLVPRSDIRELRMQLEHTLDMYYRRYGAGQSFACDLSGGMDSALIAGYLKEKGHDPLTVTMLLDGAHSAGQQQKIEALKQRFGFRNMGSALRFDTHYPLDFLTSAEQPFYHYQFGVEYTLRRELYAHLGGQGVPVIFGGQGGDELCDNTPDHTPEIHEDLMANMRMQGVSLPAWWTSVFKEYLAKASEIAEQEPERSVPLLSGSMATLRAHGGSAPFDANVWPVSPLAHPRLYQFTG